uniref:Uncharacterized protein n=1 Tax=Nelumbo nucifera TaxID=4432 RepID=A0A822Y710_NELNU|nr:TPA_asm: hypothetical protein HUJ06_029290 [Nelumbo nucifera]
MKKKREREREGKRREWAGMEETTTGSLVRRRRSRHFRFDGDRVVETKNEEEKEERERILREIREGTGRSTGGGDETERERQRGKRGRRRRREKKRIWERERERESGDGFRSADSLPSRRSIWSRVNSGFLRLPLPGDECRSAARSHLRPTMSHPTAHPAVYCEHLRGVCGAAPCRAEM